MLEPGIWAFEAAQVPPWWDQVRSLEPTTECGARGLKKHKVPENSPAFARIPGNQVPKKVPRRKMGLLHVGRGRACERERETEMERKRGLSCLTATQNINSGFCRTGPGREVGHKRLAG